MTALPVMPAESGHRSTLVTVVAWLFLVLSALAALGALLNVVVLAVTPAVTVNAAVNRVAQDTAFIHLVPAPYLFMLHHVQLVALIKLVWWVKRSGWHWRLRWHQRLETVRCLEAWALVWHSPAFSGSGSSRSYCGCSS